MLCMVYFVSLADEKKSQPVWRGPTSVKGQKIVAEMISLDFTQASGDRTQSNGKKSEAGSMYRIDQERVGATPSADPKRDENVRYPLTSVV
jgi:hypothetical protein